jgi:hypothetical protein
MKNVPSKALSNLLLSQFTNGWKGKDSGRYVFRPSIDFPYLEATGRIEQRIRDNRGLSMMKVHLKLASHRTKLCKNTLTSNRRYFILMESEAQDICLETGYSD